MRPEPKPEPLFITRDYAERMVVCANRALSDLLKHPNVTDELCLFVIKSTTDPKIRAVAAKKLMLVVQDPERLIGYSQHLYFQERYDRLAMIRKAIVTRLLKAVKDMPGNEDVDSWVRLVISEGSCYVYQRTLGDLTMRGRNNPYYIALLGAQH